MATAVCWVMRSVVVCLVIAMCTSVAAAQPGMTPAAPATTSTPLTKPRKKTPAVGTLLALAGTATPIIVLASASGRDQDSVVDGVLLAGLTAILLPSAGHWYAGKFFTPGMAIRAVGGGVATLGLVAVVGGDGEEPGTAITFGLIGLGIGVIYDVATANLAVDDWNTRQVQVAPAVLKTGDGYGVGLAGRF